MSFSLEIAGGKYTLTIKPFPSDANIKFLNIESPYQPGMLLPAGRYEVEVSRYAYTTRTQWLEIRDQSVSQNISLVWKSPTSSATQTASQPATKDRTAKVNATDQTEGDWLTIIHQADQFYENKSMRQTISMVNDLYKKNPLKLEKYKYDTRIKVSKNNIIEIKDTSHVGLFFNNTRYSVDPCSCQLTAEASFSKVWIARFTSRLNKKCFYYTKGDAWSNSTANFVDFGSNQEGAEKLAAGMRRVITLACKN